MRVILSDPADRDADRLPRHMTERVFAALRRLRDEPRPPGCILLRDRHPRTWRIRVGDWRVVYDIDDDAEIVTVLRILHRSVVYR